jgi:hypothetical protein
MQYRDFFGHGSSATGKARAELNVPAHYCCSGA